MRVSVSSALRRQRRMMPAGSISFCSNDYLAATQEKCLQEAYQEGYAKYSFGSQGSALVAGYHDIHHQVEQAFCEALGTEDAVLFTSGFNANLAVCNVLAKGNRKIYLDKQLHASWYDGLAAVELGYQRCRHQDITQLEDFLRAAPVPSVFLTESVFSMTGQCASLSTLATLQTQFDLRLLVDEAHAFGLYGNRGMGLVLAEGLNTQQVPLRTIPLGKAFGAQGAVVAGNAEWIDALVQFGRAYCYSTAMSPAQAYGILQTLAWVQTADQARQTLFDNISYFKHLIQADTRWLHSDTPIQFLRVGDPLRALEVSDALIEKGFFCLAMRPPTVAKIHSGLRVVITATHTKTQLQAFYHAIQESM
ncbi:MAG: pyridoxal phosphate-dependent aminotransferase family protein [Legionellaceae bacterium]|nr:pyridoxal phosphate-dependent aminotransferase family protein [Legionellaceae bacterium]